MQQVVFTSPYQDEVVFLDPVVKGLTFVNGVPMTVTDEQAAVILRHPFMREHDRPNVYVPPPPLDPVPEPPAEETPEETAA